MEYGYSLIKHIKINNTDPICAIDLNNELLLFGTMLGYCGFYVINTKKLILVSENEDEHIIATQIKNNKLVFAVGDEKIYIVEKKNNNYNNCSVKEVQNYTDDADHYKKCNEMYCMLRDDFLFSIEIKIPGEEEKGIDIRICDWVISNYEKNKSFNGSIKLSNYWVPFDFDGVLLIYIDFLEKKKRYLKIYNFREKKFILVKKLWEMKDGEFIGHISHIKKLKNDKIFLVHNYIYCQIRDLKFNLIKEFIHKGKEIIACDIFYNDNNELKIVLLDLNCSVFIYNEKNEFEEYLFNLHKIYYIEKEIKDQKFFSLGYPYFIKMYKKLFAITTDQGCFLFKRD